MDRRAQFEAEVTRLEGLRASLDRDWSRIRYLAALLVLAVPAAYFAGPGAAFLVVGFVGSLAATTAYLIAVRRREYTGEIELYRREIRRFDRASAPGATEQPR